jgi:purine-nucleoside phosphorylase
VSEAVVHARRAALDEAVSAVRARTAVVPELAILLDTGLEALAGHVQSELAAPSDAIPHFPSPTGVRSQLLLGVLEQRPVAVLTGGAHQHDGFTLQQVSFPVRVLRQLGARTLLIVRVCSALNPLWSARELMLIDDHINLLGDNPLVGPNLDDLGPRFPDMSVAYDPQLRAHAEQVALRERIVLRRGVYAGVAGPSLGTRAEYRMLRTLGADAVGMGAIPEVIVARHMGMRVLGIGVIGALRLPDALAPLSMSELTAAGREAEPQVTRLVRGVLGTLEH